MRISGLFLSASLSITAVEAFKVTFYNSRETACDRNFLGSVPDRPSQALQPGTCYKNYAGVGQTAKVHAWEKGDLNKMIKFYGDRDCKGPQVGGTDGGEVCLDVGYDYKTAYQSFKVVRTAGTKRSEEPIEKKRHSGMTRRAADETEASAHGQLVDLHGETWRLHQISKDSFRGVRPHEWDDNIHTPNRDELPKLDAEIEEQYIPSTTAVQRVESPLEPRNFGRRCRAVATCTVWIGNHLGTTKYSVQKYGGALVGLALSHWKQHSNKYKTLWTFLNSPFFTTSATIGAGAGYLYVKTGSDKDKPEQCSTGKNPQSQTIKSALDEITKKSDVKAAKIHIDFANGATAEIAVAFADDTHFAEFKSKCENRN